MRFPVRAEIIGIADGGPRQLLALTCEQGERLRLARDPLDRYSRNAVLVLRLDGRHLGFVCEELAEELAPLMDGGEELEAVITRITFGRDMGVHILIDEAGRLRGHDLSFLDGEVAKFERRRTRRMNRSFVGALVRSIRRLFRA